MLFLRWSSASKEGRSKGTSRWRLEALNVQGSDTFIEIHETE